DSMSHDYNTLGSESALPSSSTDCSSNSQNKVLVAKPSDLKERFTFTVKNKRWAKVADINGGPQGYSNKLTDSWTNLIRKYFHRHNGYCPIAF
ncbi:unnamed protein product, partial [Allacma fusca]